MNPVTYAFGIVAALLAMSAIVELMRRSTLRERHAVWWLVGGILTLVIAVFPPSLRWAARLLHIAVPTNLVFFVSIGLLFLISLQYAAELTRLEGRVRTLTEQSAFHELRLRDLEAGRDAAADRPDADPGDTDAGAAGDGHGEAGHLR